MKDAWMVDSRADDIIVIDHYSPIARRNQKGGGESRLKWQ
jgi:hypothetical protein